jgi:hypothetical protein
MVRIYREALDRMYAGTLTGDQPGLLKERVKALACGGITGGHFLRGLKE